MSKTTTPVSVQAEFVQDAQTGEWIATAHTPRATVRATEIRRARSYLAKELEDLLGKPVEIVEKIKLPKSLADRVAAYQRNAALIQKAREANDEAFIPLVNDLIVHRLQLQQIGPLLGVSKQWLSQQLKQDITGEYRDTPRKK